jgi:transposase, IS5 family
MHASDDQDRRDVQYGHKVFLTGGASNLILDCLIERGNPADNNWYQDLLERHREQFGRAPRQGKAETAIPIFY